MKWVNRTRPSDPFPVSKEKYFFFNISVYYEGKVHFSYNITHLSLHSKIILTVGKILPSPMHWRNTQLMIYFLKVLENGFRYISRNEKSTTNSLILNEYLKYNRNGSDFETLNC